MLEGERTTLHLNNGTAVAEVVAGCVFDNAGGFLGWHDEAGVYDPAGKRILTADEAKVVSSSGVRVIAKELPRTVTPCPRTRQTIPEKPELLREWSAVEGASLFLHRDEPREAIG